MNIVIVTDYMDCLTNGTVITAKRFAEGLIQRGHKVKLVAFGAEGNDAIALKKRYWPIVSNFAAKQNITFARYNKSVMRTAFHGADVIHLIMPVKLEKKCKYLADEMGIPTTTAFHVQPENISYAANFGDSKVINDFLYWYLKESYFKNFDHIHCPSRFIAGQLRKHGYTAKLHVISNGYDPDFIPAAQKIANEQFEIVMVGRYAPEKNQQIVIKALAKSKYKDKINLTLCGKGPDERNLRKLADEYLDGNVNFMFLSKEQLIQRLQQSDLYIHAALAEIEAISCLEAIACGVVPLIADSKLSATPQFALDDDSLYSPEDVDALAEKIDFWFEHSELRKNMSLEYAEYAKRFSLEESMVLTEAMFNQAIDENRYHRWGEIGYGNMQEIISPNDIGA